MNKDYRIISEIDGMDSPDSIDRINASLYNLGARNVDVDLSLKTIKVDYTGEEEFSAKFTDAINNLGYRTKNFVVFDPNEIYK